MRRILTVVFLISFILALPSCNYIRQKLHFGKYSLKEALEWAKQDSLNAADSVKRVIAEKEAFNKTLTDSLMSIDNTNPPQGDKSARYHIISGSFANHENALKEAGIYASQGFKPTIIILSVNNKAGLELVSVKTFTDYNEAQTFLKGFSGSYDEEAWIYSQK